MKKMWMVAALVCAALMVSCGGEKKAEKKAEATPAVETVAPVAVPGQAVETVAVPGQDVEALTGAEPEAAPIAVEPVAATSGATVTEPVSTNSTVAAKATELANKLVAAMKSGDAVLVEKITAEGDAYLETLSEADQAVFEEAVAKVAVAAGLM